MQPPNDQSPQYPYQQPPPPPPYQYPQPGSFGPPVKPPGRIRRFTTWYMRQNLLTKIIVGAVIAFLVIFVGSAAIAGIADSGNPDLAATPTAVVASQPTSAPATQAPAPTPTRTPTVKQNIIQIVNSKASQATKIEFAQNDGSTVIVQITLSNMASSGLARDAIKFNCFDIEKALWTAHISSLKDVDLAFRGPSVDKYGNTGTSPYGVCDLKKGTAEKFNWDNLDDFSAWDAYDQASFFTIISG